MGHHGDLLLKSAIGWAQVVKLPLSWKRVLINPSVLHDDQKVFGGVFDQPNIFERIAIDKQQISPRAPSPG